MKHRPLCMACLVICMFLSGVILTGGSFVLEELKESPLEKYQSEEDAVCVQGTVYDIQTGGTYQALYLKDNIVRSTKENHRSYKESKILVYLEEENDLSIGNQIQIEGTLKFFQKARNPGNFDQKLYYQKLNIHGMVWAERLQVVSGESWKLKNILYQLRQGWKKNLLLAMGEKDGNILSAMLLGEKKGMDQETKDLYQANGISHILAISSLHLTFVGGSVYRRMRKTTGSYLLSGITGGLFLAVYILMIGFTVSAVRALVMFLFQVGADIAGRKYDAPTAYSVAAMIVLLWRPLSLYDGGFWMSFGAIGAILFVYPVLSESDSVKDGREVNCGKKGSREVNCDKKARCEINNGKGKNGENLRRAWSMVRESLLVSLSIQLVLLPIQLLCFYEIQPISLLMNLFVIPLMSVMLTAGMSGSFLLILKVQSLRKAGIIVLWICKGILKIYEDSCRMTLEFPGARIITGAPEKWAVFVYYLILFTSVLLYKYKKWRKARMQNKQTDQSQDKMKKRQKRRGVAWLTAESRAVWLSVALMFGIFLLNVHPGEWGKLRVTFLDVGQGDCIYIKSPYGISYLMDGGSSDIKNVGRYRMEPYLKYRGVKRLDYVFVSHGDADHINGIQELLERNKIGVDIGMLVLPEQFAWNDALYGLAELAKEQGVPVAVMKSGGQIKGQGDKKEKKQRNERKNGQQKEEKNKQQFTITCLGPEDTGAEPGNETSMILAVQCGSIDILLTGDVEGNGEEHLQKVLEAEYPDTRWDILKAAHHGSKNSSKEAFLETIHPIETVISAGIRNRYGHPHAETIERLENTGSKIRLTKEQGAVEYLLGIH